MLSPVQTSAALSSTEGSVVGSESKEVMDINADFPPLSTSVITVPVVDGRTEQTNQIEDENIADAVLPQQAQPRLNVEVVGPSTAVPPLSVTTVPGVPSPSESNLSQSGSDKLPFVQSPNSEDKKDDEEEGDDVGVRGSRSATLLPDNEEGVPSSLAVGKRSFKAANPAAATSQSSQQVWI